LTSLTSISLWWKRSKTRQPPGNCPRYIIVFFTIPCASNWLTSLDLRKPKAARRGLSTLAFPRECLGRNLGKRLPENSLQDKDNSILFTFLV
jgi:hypothetical protein